jgi:hypothetical protein
MSFKRELHTINWPILGSSHRLLGGLRICLMRSQTLVGPERGSVKNPLAGGVNGTRLGFKRMVGRGLDAQKTLPLNGCDPAPAGTRQGVKFWQESPIMAYPKWVEGQKETPAR